MQVIIEPEMFLTYMKGQGKLPKFVIPKKIIFSYLPIKYPEVKNSNTTEKPVSHKFFGARFDLFENKKVGVVSQFGFGAPALTIELELLVAMGAKEFIGVGTAGSISSELNVGDFMLCEKALRGEGVSAHYASSSEYSYPSEKLNLNIRNAFNGKKLNFYEGATWSTDAVYREAVDEVRKYREMGIKTVEMEASALFAVACHRNVEAASLFVVSDLLTNDKWEPHLHSVTSKLTTLLEVAFTAFDR